MPRKPTPPPNVELAVVRELAAELAEVEAQAAELRARRDRAMVMARHAGATGQHLADAARIDIRNVWPIVRVD